MTKQYQTLKNLSKNAEIFNGILMLLEWDKETHMPANAINLRSEQIEQLSSIIHQKKTSKEFLKALSSLIDIDSGDLLHSELSDTEAAALREWRREYIQIAKLPLAFVEEEAKVTSESAHAWAEAKSKNSFKLFLPHLEKVISLSRRKADFLGYKDHPYDPLIDSFEPGMTTRELTTLFERLKIPLTTLLKDIQTKPDPDPSILHKTYPHDRQLSFGKTLLTAMGFDRGFSRLDESMHPMCLPIHPDDTRMTTTILPNRPLSSILSCLHEAGHALYHTNIPKEYYGTPLGQPSSLAMDESQSRTWETLVGRSFPFWQHMLPRLQKAFPEHLSGVSLEQFYKMINIIEPSLIRVESDEVSYNLHIMVRFEIEKALIENAAQPHELPELWNEKMREYLSITPKADSEGCLQDIHWSLGAFGYFPTYCLGNLYAAQFFEAFKDTHPNWKEQLSKGNLEQLSKWQRTHIHQRGRYYLPGDLCEKVTGKPLSELAFINYLKEKYTPLYHL